MYHNFRKFFGDISLLGLLWTGVKIRTIKALVPLKG